MPRKGGAKEIWGAVRDTISRTDLHASKYSESLLGVFGFGPRITVYHSGLLENNSTMPSAAEVLREHLLDALLVGL